MTVSACYPRLLVAALLLAAGVLLPAQGARAESQDLLYLPNYGVAPRGKTVTRVQGLGGDAAALSALARELKRALGCGASVEEECQRLGVCTRAGCVQETGVICRVNATQGELQARV